MKELLTDHWLSLIALIVPILSILNYFGMPVSIWGIILPGMVFLWIAVYLIAGIFWALIKEFIKD